MSDYACDERMDEVQQCLQRTFPAGCTIRNIRPGTGGRKQWVYAGLYGPDGELLISATLEYINAQFVGARLAGPNGRAKPEPTACGGQ